MPTNLTTVAQEVLSDLEVRLQQTGGRVEVDNLPIIDAEPLQMRQLLQNLISNALKFHRPGQPPQVWLKSSPLGDLEQQAADMPTSAMMCQIIVSDNGVGFDQKYQEQIFQAFQRLHGRSAYEGTGMGLAICRRIAERHKDTISATSTLGQGATFIVTLPIQHQPGSAE